MANKYIQRQVSTFARGVKQLLLGSSLLVLAACGSNSTSDSTVANPTQTSTATSVGDSKLLASLAASYPNGKLPADRAAQAEKDLGQNPETNLTGGSNGRGLQYFNAPNSKSLIFSINLKF